MGVTAIVTGAGGPAGVSVIRALRASGDVRVVAVDADPTAVGLRLGDDAAVVPRCDAADFADAIVDLALRQGATALIATVAEEMGALDAAGERLAAVDLRTWLPSAQAVADCVDKWRFAQAVAQAPLATPATALGSADGVPGPWIVKPRFGRGSRDVYPVDDVDELAWALRRVPDPVVQTRVDGREFTVDALVDRGGALVGAVPRWRAETKAGISTKGTTFADDRVVEDVATLAGVLGLTGPCNVQGFVAADGTPWFIEVNPRFSGGLPLSLAAGADLVGEYLRGVLGFPLRPERLSYRVGVSMLRYFSEVFEGPEVSAS